MRRWAEFVLAHRKLTMLFWLLVIVGGGIASGQVNDRLTAEYSLPGEPGAETADAIVAKFDNGGYQAPYLISVTYPAGQTVAGHEAEVAAAFDRVAAEVPTVRVLHQGNTGDPVFRTDDGRTSFAMLFFQFNYLGDQQLPTESIETALDAAKPAGTAIGVTGNDVLAAGGSRRVSACSPRW